MPPRRDPNAVVGEQHPESGDEPDEDVMRILIATDTHVGFMERDPIRGDDSFAVWEEILEMASGLKVDALLHGGDLFHDNKPSRQTLLRTMDLLRLHCLGDAPVRLELLSDARVNFPSRGCVNYEDPNLNVALPLFLVHGNHDDPAGDGQHSAIDVLSAAGLVNYFGRVERVDNIALAPVLLRKGRTQMALYGLGNIRDERLYTTFQDGKVHLLQPEGPADDWFNMFVIHQNRASRAPRNSISDALLDPCLDLVLWGHEHDCRVHDVALNSTGDFYILQPGSSIATSLSEGERLAKHVVLLEVRGKKFRLTPQPLRRVRPLLMENVALSALPELTPTSDPELIARALAARVDALLSSVPPQPLPLVRLRVDAAGGFATVPPARFLLHVDGRVANPQDVLLWTRTRTTRAAGTEEGDKEAADKETVAVGREADEARILSLIAAHLTPGSAPGPLKVLPPSNLHEALQLFVHKEEAGAFATTLEHDLRHLTTLLTATDRPYTSADDVARQFSQLDVAARHPPPAPAPPPQGQDQEGDPAHQAEVVPRKRKRAATVEEKPRKEAKRELSPPPTPNPRAPTVIDLVDKPTTSKKNFGARKKE